MTVICLTIDIDWVHDQVIADTLALTESAGIKATWFATHATTLLSDIAAEGDHEIGIHPNFNPSLDGDGRKARDVIERLVEIAPGAHSMRSHSLARSTRIAQLIRTMGFTHELNFLIPPHVGNTILPWRDFCGLIQVPIRWEDDVCLVDQSLGEPQSYVGKLELFVVNMHPIHLYLNSVSVDDYELARSFFGDPAGLLSRRRPPGSGGTRDRFLALASTARSLWIKYQRIWRIAGGVTLMRIAVIGRTHWLILVAKRLAQSDQCDCSRCNYDGPGRISGAI